VRTLSAEVLPESLHERAEILRGIAEVARVTPLASAVLLADTRARHFGDRSRARAFLNWVEGCFGSPVNHEYLYHVVAVGQLLEYSREAKWCSTTLDLAAALRRLPYNVLHVLTQLARPHDLTEFWGDFGAQIEGASREDVRGWVDEFYAKKGKKRKAVKRDRQALPTLTPATLVERFGAVEPRLILDAADSMSPDTGLSVLRHAITLTERQAEKGIFAKADMATLGNTLAGALRRVLPLMKSAGISIKL